jgi:hypothetical protein
MVGKLAHFLLQNDVIFGVTNVAVFLAIWLPFYKFLVLAKVTLF